MIKRFDEITQQHAMRRRDFLRCAALAGAGQLFSISAQGKGRTPAETKVIVVTFGGGARDEETFAPEGQQNIPHLIHELIPQATFFTQVVNRGILGHYVATASLATGVYESFDNFAEVAPINPTVFEYFRKGLRRPLNDAWVIAPSNGFSRIGQSDGSKISAGYGAQVVLPKRVLSSSLGESDHGSENLQFVLQDNFEDAMFSPPTDQQYEQAKQIASLLHLSMDDYIKAAKPLSSADELSVYVLRHVMQRFAPSLIWITLHDMDVAHTGSYSLYLSGIRRTDRLCADIWHMVAENPEYKDKTTLLILPDFGRDSDISPGGNGFQHHRTGDPLSRTTWLLAMGPHIRQNATVNRPLDSLDVVPTIGRLMGFETPRAQGSPALELL